MKFFKSALFLLFFSLIFLQASSAMGQFFFFQHPLQDKAAPDFVLKTTEGKTVSMSQYRNGQPGIIFFWSTWCPHCRTQLSDLYKNREEVKKQGIKIILVDIQETSKEVKDYLKKRNINFEIFLDENAEIADQYSIVGIPAFFFVDPEGKVIAVKNFLPEDYLRLFKNQDTGLSFSESPRQAINNLD